MSLQTKTDGLGDDGRDPALDRLYAQSAREEPPARLDAAILAAARREVHSRPRRLGSIVRTLRAPVAIAAVVVLSASLVMLMKEEKADRFYEAPPPAEPPSDAAGKAQAEEPPPASPVPQAARRRDPEPASPPAPAAERRAPRLQDRQARNDSPRPAEAVPPAAQPFPAPAPAGEERGRMEQPARKLQERLGAAREAESGPAASGKAADRPAAGLAAPEAPPAKPSPQGDALAKQRSEADAGTRGLEQFARSAPEVAAQAAPPPPAKPAPRPQAKAAQPASRAPIWSGYERQPPDQWLERIADLRRTGRDADVLEMLEEFRKRFPDYPLPASLAR